MKTKLLALVLLLLIPAFLLLFLGNLRRQHSSKALASERAITTVKLTAANFSYYFREGRQQLATMTQFPLVVQKDRALTEKGLKNLKRLLPDFDDFGLVETNGVVFAHTLDTNVAQTVSQSLLRKVETSRDFSVGIFNRDSRQNQPHLQFAFPVLGTQGGLRRVMYASLKSQRLSDALTNVFLPPGGIVTVFDRDGNLLARQPDGDEWIGRDLSTAPFFQKAFEEKEGTFVAEGMDAVQQVFAVSTVSVRNDPILLVTVEVPQSEVFGQANQEFIQDSVLILIIVALLLAAAWWYSDRFFLRPATAVVAAADKIAEGDFKARTGLSKGKGELHRLAERFDQMAASLERRQYQLEQANGEIKSHNAQLEKRVAERTNELQMLNHELEAFSYSVSHDLRVPLRHMNGFASMVLNHPKVQEDADLQRQLGVIMDAAKKMGQMIDALLSLARFGRQPLAMRTVDFNQMVREVLAEIAATEPDRIIDWKIENLPQVHGDPALLRLVWLNLIGNAVKYTREKKSAIITISTRSTGAETEFFVTDNGAGFDMAYAHNLFGVFQRLHKPDEFEGTGVGLANVRRIISRHGGRTWAEGKPGAGATFGFSLPNQAV